MEKYKQLKLTTPACVYSNCGYHKNNVIYLGPTALPKLYLTLYGIELKEEDTAKTDDGFTVMITPESAKRYYMYKLMKSVSEEEQMELKIVDQFSQTIRKQRP